MSIGVNGSLRRTLSRAGGGSPKSFLETRRALAKGDLVDNDIGSSRGAAGGMTRIAKYSQLQATPRVERGVNPINSLALPPEP